MVIEYVMITSLLVVMLVGGSKALFNPAPGVGADGTFDFGYLGNAFVNWYHRLVSGVMLPIP